MKILALEFSTERRSAAVLGEGSPRSKVKARLVAEECISVSADGRDIGGLTLVERALAAAKREREDIDCLAVGLGPGSYTGIRSAIAIAQGWQLARDVKVLGVSSVDCLVAQTQAAGLRGKINFVIDAQRGEFYLASCLLDDAAPEPVGMLRLATRAEIQAREQRGELIVGPEVTRWFPKGREIVPDAATVAALANGREDFVAADQLQPIYLRETNFVKAPPPRRIE